MDISCIQPKIVPVLQPNLDMLPRGCSLPVIECTGGGGFFTANGWPESLAFWFSSSNATDWDATLQMFHGTEMIYNGEFHAMLGARFGWVTITDDHILVYNMEYSYTLTVSKVGYSSYVENGVYNTPAI